ncbi:short-chain dehydrogenase (plasmid) [Pseudonocardia sp. EC080610-09]|uniref:SDR family NAD(P)-dependent oxidoreductase n=1 Tax=unclassified Pseudonocardia TaxID=2619320 RepID=UPI000706064E|nr:MULTISPECIES: SDR family NAD(P)-dependent oxidoreductase [unclassified Pseudonocardia]ALL79236.1 short-chain dehydrogenase [Pseudonocardia sp. EC080610-09]ALL79771.1 short-chain dehydrogenase [Pseudonocardia sp. EC080610-09]ALL85207.1 short-chain dehydrogenase [Pseudonocardia sp. EC080619-01]
MVDFGLHGRTVLVTGGASGIGRATAGLAAAAGAQVAVLDLNADAVTDAVDELTATGATVAGYPVDVCEEKDVVEAVGRVERELGPIQGVVAAAGVSRPKRAVEMSAREFAETIDVNLVGLFATAAATGTAMLERGSGCFVAIGSTDSLGGHVDRTHYAASKHGVVGLVKSLAIEWGPGGVRANVVAPGVVDTPLLRSVHDEASIARNFLGKIPAARLARSEDQANAALFLLSDAASYISGAVLPVDGGLTAGYFNTFDRP